MLRLFRREKLLHVAERRGEGPTVILIHGIASSSVTFQNVIPLVEGDHRCITIDLLGFGQSPIPVNSEYTITEHVAALSRVIRSLKLRDPFILVGHSMGALIASRYAAGEPRRVSKLVLVSPPIYIASTELSNALDRGVMDLHLRAYEYLRLNKDFTLKHARMLERLLPIPGALQVTEQNWTPFIKSLENTIESQTTISDLAAVRAPVEIVYGSMDQFNSDGGLKIASRLNGVSVHRVEGSDHLIGKRLARVVAIAIRSGPDKSDKTDESDKSNETDKSDKSDVLEKSDTTETPDVVDQPGFLSRLAHPLRRTQKLPPQRAERRLEAYVYGNVLVLVALATADRSSVLSGEALIYVAGTAVSTYVAHVLAVLVAGRVTESHSVRHALRDSVPIASSAIFPAVVLGASALGWPPPGTAIVLSISTLLVRFLLLGTVSSYVSGERRPLLNLAVGIGLATVAFAVAAFKILVT